jgi:hypothetical protein
LIDRHACLQPQGVVRFLRPQEHFACHREAASKSEAAAAGLRPLELVRTPTHRRKRGLPFRGRLACLAVRKQVTCPKMAV